MRNRSDNKVSVALIRHAPTRGNLLRRYIGVTDEDILGSECLSRDYPNCDTVISSPMKRCIETAKLIYPDKRVVICEKLRECDFGDFENKSYEDLKDDARYQQWIDSNGELPFPNGDSKSDLIKRSIEGFFETLPESGAVSYVIHGGNIMAVMQSLFGGGFYDYQVKNGCGYKFEMKGGSADAYCSIGSA